MRGKLVGRGRELDAALRALDATVCGWGSVFVLAGEAGIGKSRLAEEIAGIARNRGMEVVWSGGWPGGGPPPYWPWPEVLGAIESPSDGAPGQSSTYPSSERTGWFRSVAAALRERARRRPLLVVLDDAHTIDPDGLLLTRFVARTIVGHPVSLLLTHRS
ncbi:MAG TPA: ATP-binding protein, partial [Acidimicrobiales bacterium]|nr:ATP-binding protein [Acidimicrobiales bacterium]